MVYCSGCMACLTAYIIYFCTETHYEKCLKKVSRFVHEQNEQVQFLSFNKKIYEEWGYEKLHKINLGCV